MPLVRCIPARTERNAQDQNAGKFIHPDEPSWPQAVESNLAKRKRAEAAAAAAAGYGSRDNGYGSRSKGGRDSGRASITSSTSGWGDTGGAKSPSRSRRDPSPGWGAPNNSGGWGTSSNSGWGASPGGGGWGESSGNSDWENKSGDGGFGNTSGSGWGDNSGAWDNPEPSSRRTSTFSAPKSPAKAPTSPRRERESDKSSSKERDRDRERYKERERDGDRDRRREESNSSPSRTHRSQRRSPSPSRPSSKSSSRKESNRSPERSKPNASVETDVMDVDPPNPSSIGTVSSLSASAHKDPSTTSVPATTTTTQPAAATPTTEMPISISFPRRQPDGLPPPLGSGAPSVPRPPSAQSFMPPPPPPLGTPPVVPPPPVGSAKSKASSKSPPQSSDATTTHSLPARPSGATGSRSPPQTRTIATPMVPHGSSKSPVTPATPATPATPVAPVAPTTAPATAAPTTPVIPAPSPPVAPTPPAIERPYEWIESLESLIKQNRVLHNCKQQYARAEAQEKLLLSVIGPKRGSGDTAPSLADMRRRIESTESEMQTLLRQFAMRMEIFYHPSEVAKSVDTGKVDEETLSLARKLSDQVSLLESEMQMLQITTKDGAEDLKKKLEENAKTSSQAILKERGERTKTVEDVKKDVKVLGDDLNRTKIECERLREELVTNGSNLDQVRCDTQTVREQQISVKDEVKAVKVEAEATKADVQTVKTKVGDVGKEVAEIKAEMEKLKTKIKTPPPSPARAPIPPGPTPGKRARNGIVSPGSNAMEVDDVLPPAKRVRTVDPLRPSPFIDSTTPMGSPGSMRRDGSIHKELLERLDALEDLVETLQGDVLQVGNDVQDQLDEFSERWGSSEERVIGATATSEARAESAPPSSTTKTDFPRVPGRSSAPPSQATLPPSWMPAKLPTVDELPSDDAIGTIRVDLDAMMGQVVGLWKGEGEWPAHVQMNLCKALGVESLDQVFKPTPPSEPVVNGKKPEPEEDWAAMFKSMKEEQDKMREEMRKERMEQDARMKAMMERLERTEEALDMSAKRRSEVERECEALKTQQAEQRQLLVHLQSVVDNIPKPGNGMLSPEGLLQDAMRNGASPVQQELAALRKLATTVPALLALAGLSAEKEN